LLKEKHGGGDKLMKIYVRMLLDEFHTAADINSIEHNMTLQTAKLVWAEMIKSKDEHRPFYYPIDEADVRFEEPRTLSRRIFADYDRNVKLWLKGLICDQCVYQWNSGGSSKVTV
jgi:hypothetical protein